MKKFLLFSILSVLLISCSNPLNKKFNDKNFDKDMAAIIESKKLNKEDEELLLGWVLLNGFEMASGKTYKQILNEAKNYTKKEKDKEEEKNK